MHVYRRVYWFIDCVICVVQQYSPSPEVRSTYYLIAHADVQLYACRPRPLITSRQKYTFLFMKWDDLWINHWNGVRVLPEWQRNDRSDTLNKCVKSCLYFYDCRRLHHVVWSKTGSVPRSGWQWFSRDQQAACSTSLVFVVGPRYIALQTFIKYRSRRRMWPDQWDGTLVWQRMCVIVWGGGGGGTAVLILAGVLVEVAVFGRFASW